MDQSHLKTELGGEHVEGTRRDKDGAADAKGMLSGASKEASRVLEMPQQTTSSPALIMIFPVQRKLTNLADVPSALTLPSEEQVYVPTLF